MKKIGIATRIEAPGLKRMFETLGKALNFSIEESTFGNDSKIEAWVFLGVERESVSHIESSDRPCYAVIHDDQLVPCGKSSAITFSKHSVLTDIFSDRQITADEAVDLKSLPSWIENITPLASKEGAPIWAIQEYNQLRHYYVAMSIPELNIDEPLYAYFHGKQFLSILPFLIFLKSLKEDQRWEQPPLQASFMFDDPNLHWPTYGFINFAELLQHAKLYNYHISFATIPLDSWFVHPPTASLFRGNEERLSFLIHGNDHVSNELARPYSAEKIDKILRQALERINRMENRTGLKVARVMTPPHGACSEQSLSEMALHGFEAACISRGSLRHHNITAKWTLTIGMKTCDMIAGLPVFPRFPLSKSCYNSILIAALLHQPIIPRAHHKDIAEGLQQLEELSEFINSLGDVHWADMKQISRSSYARMVDGKILHLKMFTNRIEVYTPEGINQIRVKRSWLKRTASAPLIWRILGEDSNWKICCPGECIAVLPGKRVEIVSKPVHRLQINAKTPRTKRLFPLIRRFLTETRDRLTPVLCRPKIKSSGR